MTAGAFRFAGRFEFRWLGCFGWWPSFRAAIFRAQNESLRRPGTNPTEPSRPVQGGNGHLSPSVRRSNEKKIFRPRFQRRNGENPIPNQGVVEVPHDTNTMNFETVKEDARRQQDW